MRLVTFLAGNSTHLGILLEQQIVDLPGAYRLWLQTNTAANSAIPDALPFPTSVLAFLQTDAVTRTLADQVLAFALDEHNRAALARAGLLYSPNDITFLPPIPRPGKIICLGHNYRKHIAELGLLENPVVAPR